jgi:hypothetical protein
MKYTTNYTSSNGQPSNAHETHETLNAALAAWKANIGSLLHRSGGESTLEVWGDSAFKQDHAEPQASLSWFEHCEGGFITANGYWAEGIQHLATLSESYGDKLTVEKVIRHLSE